MTKKVIKKPKSKNPESVRSNDRDMRSPQYLKEITYACLDNKYNNEAGPRLIEILSAGGGVAEFCAEQDISWRTFYEWKDKYPDFKRAYEKGLTRLEAYHDKVLRENLFNPDFNERLYTKSIERTFGKRNKTRMQTKYIKAGNLLGTLNKAIERAENGHIDLDELQQLVVSISEIGKLKVNVDLEEKIKLLQSLVDRNMSDDDE